MYDVDEPLDYEGEETYTFKNEAESCCIRVGDFSVYLEPDDRDGLAITVYEQGYEDRDEIQRVYFNPIPMKTTDDI